MEWRSIRTQGRFLVLARNLLFMDGDEDITMLDIHDSALSPDYKSSSIWTSSVRNQLTTLYQKTMISPSYDIQIKHSCMHWKPDDEMFFFWFQLQNPHGSFSAATTNCCITSFGSSRAFYHAPSPSCRCSHPNPRKSPFRL